MSAETVFLKTPGLTGKPMHYCPGCTHGVIHRLVGEVVTELSLRERTVAISPVGCAVFSYEYFEMDAQEASHGRAPAVATGVKRARPDLIVFTYQGDGDLASIGMAEIVHAANRGEKITVVFVNNAIYGMTGGQMAPTTMPGQVATTCPLGRDVTKVGFPIRVAEMLATLRTPGFIARGSVHDPLHIVRTKDLIRRAFTLQRDDTCFSLVEVLSTCPTNWGLTPAESLGWLESTMLPYYPLGVFKTPDGPDRAPAPLGPRPLAPPTR
jgi:2-oxoglutarate ferredoxin oxidoreductase subunit beta